MALAVEHDLVVRIGRRPGKFVIDGGELARVWPGDRLDDALAAAVRGAFYIGPQRNLTQDVEFAIDQLVEVAVRALSPGVNDPFTAIACVDRLGEALCALAGREVPSPYRYDDGRPAPRWSPTCRRCRGSWTRPSTRSARRPAATRP